MATLLKAMSDVNHQFKPVISPPFKEAKTDRLMSLDVLRGITVAGMILVNSAGSPSHTFNQLKHALWNNPTATDVIFPCFLMIVGISLSLSFAARIDRRDPRNQLLLHALRRALLLFGLGLIVNSFWILVQGSWRIPGILQRIGLCYTFAAPLYLLLCSPALSSRRRRDVLLICAFGLLVLYGLLLKFYPTPVFGHGHLDPYRNVAAVMDRQILTPARMFQYGLRGPGGVIAFDPEGILSTLGALATMLFGAAAGEELRQDRSRSQQVRRLAVGGTTLWLAGLSLSQPFPLNKALYTPSFALWSSGLSILLFAGLLWLIDLRRLRRGWRVALIFGTNAIFAFLVSQILTGLLLLWRDPRQDTAMYERVSNWLFASWLPLPIASLSWAVLITLIIAAIVYPLYRKRIFLRL